MKLKTDNSLSFCWSKQTHVAMTLKAIENNKILSISEKEMLAACTKMPDELSSEKGYYNNTHFYFPDEKTRSYGRNPETNNALQKFIEHYKRALKADTKKGFLYETAFALHFLQDANTPLHTEKGNLLTKIRDYYLHKNFERGKKNGAETKSAELLNNYVPQKIDFLKLDDLFIKTAKFSAQDKYKVSRFNKSKWEEIQQECFNYCVSATKEFVDFMLNFIPKK